MKWTYYIGKLIKVVIYCIIVWGTLALGDYIFSKAIENNFVQFIMFIGLSLIILCLFIIEVIFGIIYFLTNLWR